MTTRLKLFLAFSALLLLTSVAAIGYRIMNPTPRIIVISAEPGHDFASVFDSEPKTDFHDIAVSMAASRRTDSASRPTARLGVREAVAAAIRSMKRDNFYDHARPIAVECLPECYAIFFPAVLPAGQPDFLKGKHYLGMIILVNAFTGKTLGSLDMAPYQ